MQTLFQDLRYGARMLLKQPGFTVIAVLTLALGIGANGVIFSVVNALLLRPLPVNNPHELVALYTSDFSSTQTGPSAYLDYLDLRARNQSFAGLVAYQPHAFSINMDRLDGANERAFGEIVSGNYFDVLGLKPAIGRGFLPEEDRTPNTHAVVVISHKLWQTRFSGDANVLGRVVNVNGFPFTIVGVAPEKYRGLIRGFAADWWVPAMMNAQAAPGSNNLTTRGSRSFLLMGRLKPGVTHAQAQADCNNLAAQLLREWPQNWENIRKEGRSLTLIPERDARLLNDFQEPAMIFSALLMTVVGLVLLIACANVANLLLARATARRKEIAVRLALGAGRWRLVRQLLTESVMLALLGGVAGWLLATWGAEALMLFQPPVPIPFELNLQGDGRVFGFMFGLSLLTGIIFGLMPALAASRPDVVEALKDDAGNATWKRGRLRNALVVAQVALSLLLLVCAGLFLRSLQNASAVDPGFDANNLLMMSMDLQMQGYDEAKGRNFNDQLLSRVRALPGVVAASLTDKLPLGFDASRRGIMIEGYQAQPGESTEVASCIVASGYFETLRIPLLQGRVFAAQDHEQAPGVVVINEAFARRYWPNESPLGKRIQRGIVREGVNDAPWLTVVGVVKDGKYSSLGEDATPFFYLNEAQLYEESPTLIVRTQGNPAELIAAVRNEVLALDKNLPLTDVKTMREHLGLALFPARLAGSVLGVFGLVALLLAAAGIYGVMAYTVAQRTREIGIRLALGADARDVLGLVIRQGMTLVLIGVTIGLVAALALTQLLKSLLFGVSATDPLTFVGIVLLLSFVALLACSIPARRATKVDPMIALRCE